MEEVLPGSQTEISTVKNNYIVLTDGGYTQDDEGSDTENCQLIGVYYKTTKELAIKAAIKDNRTRGHTFNPDSLFVYRLVED